ncbi:hypothetical protein BJ138DRAFT_1113486 [Hygrophoropsis aurantiaca]|uniref:Uncharacterized protein n=1 Tax=Hygrophoropsis aurantiaca TaxID=72124 RepID=A0ACB8AC80_9AGAM|nr:hypothetical protein BJ138DRAFT_1113486 [Hygrophoropsis aurantiaca]
MTRSGQPFKATTGPPILKEKKRKNFYEHGKDALELAMTVGACQEDKSLRKAEKHHQPQPGQPRSDRKDVKSRQKNKLKETKAIIASSRARSKREKAKLRKDTPGGQVDRRGTAAPDVAEKSSTRKKVSFA